MSENASYIVLSRQMALQRQMDVIANNIANMNTTAFKTERVLFEEYLMDADTGQKLAYVRDFGTSRDLQQGEMRSTLNPLDMAISGDGYFTVQTPQGLRYTRNGHFKIDGQGYLVTASGLQVLDNTNQPIQLNPSDTKFDVGQDGTITGSQGPIGRLAMVSFQNEQNLVPVGNGLYRTDDPVQPAAKASVVQGMIESSNVEPIMEMTRMIEASRAYQSTQAVLSRDDDIRRQAINRLGRVSS